MAKEITDFLVDKRIVDRNIEKGLLSQKEHEKYLKSLDDAEGNMEYVDLSEPEEASGESEEPTPTRGAPEEG